MVTGAGGGIGRAMCHALKTAGAHVIGTDVTSEPPDLGIPTWYRHDVTEWQAWTEVVSSIEQRFGRLDCLINNAGIALSESIANTTLEQWRRLMSVNVESIFLGLRACLPLLRKSGAERPGGSTVVNVSSTAGLRGVPFGAAYSTTKGAVALLTKSAAKEFGALGYPIRVNSVHPGAIETSMLESIVAQQVESGFAKSAEALSDTWKTMAALHRNGQPCEIAGGAVFLCSAASSFMTGAELVIDGGAIC